MSSLTLDDARLLLGMLCIAVGVSFDLLGCIGLIRMPDVYNRLQASTKCVTLGTCSVLLGAAVLAGGAVAAKAFLCMIFVLIACPTAAHALARAAHRSGIRLWEGSVGDAYLEDRSRRREE
jgi:multicomponent Na+:H+ antiporter subunit G